MAKGVHPLAGLGAIDHMGVPVKAPKAAPKLAVMGMGYKDAVLGPSTSLASRVRQGIRAGEHATKSSYPAPPKVKKT